MINPGRDTGTARLCNLLQLTWRTNVLTAHETKSEGNMNVAGMQTQGSDEPRGNDRRKEQGRRGNSVKASRQGRTDRARHGPSCMQGRPLSGMSLFFACLGPATSAWASQVELQTALLVYAACRCQLLAERLALWTPTPVTGLGCCAVVMQRRAVPPDDGWASDAMRFALRSCCVQT